MLCIQLDQCNSVTFAGRSNRVHIVLSRAAIDLMWFYLPLPDLPQVQGKLDIGSATISAGVRSLFFLVWSELIFLSLFLPARLFFSVVMIHLQNSPGFGDGSPHIPPASSSSSVPAAATAEGQPVGGLALEAAMVVSPAAAASAASATPPAAAAAAAVAAAADFDRRRTEWERWRVVEEANFAKRLREKVTRRSIRSLYHYVFL